MRLTITPVIGEPYTVRTSAMDEIAWETYALKHNKPVQVKVTRGGEVDISHFPMRTYQGFLAYKAATRGVPDAPSFDDWMADVDSIELEDDDDPVAELRPTLPAPSHA